MAKKKPRKTAPARSTPAPMAARGRWTGGLVIAVGVVALAWLLLPERGGSEVDVRVPALSPTAEAGREAFAANCASCHGPAAGGTDRGPPLVHRIYEPGHHADQSFVLAAKRGVRQHHWQFGNMPAQPQLGDRSLQQIIAHVRELQRANGIE